MHAIVIRFIIIFLKILIYVLPYDEPVKSEICRNFRVFKKYYCGSEGNCVQLFVKFDLN